MDEDYDVYSDEAKAAVAAKKAKKDAKAKAKKEKKREARRGGGTASLTLSLRNAGAALERAFDGMVGRCRLTLSNPR